PRVAIDRLGDLGSELVVEAAVICFERRLSLTRQVVRHADSRRDVHFEVVQLGLGKRSRCDKSSCWTRLRRQKCLEAVESDTVVDRRATDQPPIFSKGRPGL